MLLRLRACGLCGTDLFKLANDTAPSGMVLGHELTGTVEALGAGTGGFEIGDRVVVPHHVPCGECALCARGSDTLCAVFRENLLEPGGFSEHVVVRERAVRLAARKIPDGIADEAAIFLEPAACVLRGVQRAGLPSVDASLATCAVVLGAGSMGLLHLLVLRATHPRIKVFVSDTVEDRLELARRLGADDVGMPREIASVVREATQDFGADAVFDTVGGAAVLQSALGLTREGGTVVLFAHAASGDHAGFDLNTVFKYERRVLGTYSGSLKEQEEVFQLIVRGRLDASALVTHRLPLSRFEDAVAVSRDRKALKVLMTPEV
jgi:L-iditol 2-dehydrogenase